MAGGKGAGGAPGPRRRAGTGGRRRLTNGEVEVVVSTDVGPRVLRYGLVGGENVLGEAADLEATTDLGTWRAWGGHRFWVAPEVMPGSYAPDDQPVRCARVGRHGLRLTPPTDASGMQKTLTVALDPRGTGVTLSHTLTNGTAWSVQVAAWALTIMRPGGVVLLPQEPFRPHGEVLLPARPLVLWPYTRLADSRLTLGDRFIRLRPDPSLSAPQKIGLGNAQGWCAYSLGRLLFVKRFAYQRGATYPDFGSNVEVFVKGDFVEVETLGPLATLAPGESVEHVERWHLLDDVPLGTGDGEADDDQVAAALEPRLAALATAGAER